MLRVFEQRLDPFHPTRVPPAPEGLARFLWACTGAPAAISLRLRCSAPVCRSTKPGCFPSSVRSWTCSRPGKPVVRAAAQESRLLWGMGIVMVASIGLVALRTMVQHQVLAINLPLRLRWDFHRLMLPPKPVVFFR